MTIEDAVNTLQRNGYLIGQSNDGYWHYCKNLEESTYATDNAVKDLARTYKLMEELTTNLSTDEWRLLCDVSKEVCGFKDGEEIGHYPTYWYPPREWSQDPIHKSKWNPLASLEQAREVWRWAKKLTNSDYTFDFETVTPTKVCEESLRVVRNARWCGVVNTAPGGDECYVWRCICASPGGIRLNKGCDMCEYEEIADNG